jgi:hypothetical protein
MPTVEEFEDWRPHHRPWQPLDSIERIYRLVSSSFDGLVAFNHAGVLTKVLEFARAANAREIEIVGHRGAVRLSNGHTIVEEPTIGKNVR